MAISTSSTASTLKGYNTTLSDLLKGVNKLWDKGPKTFNQSTYAGVGPTTKSAWQMSLDAAGSPWYRAGIDKAGSAATDLISKGGLTDAMRGDISTVGDATRDYASIADRAMDPSLTETTLGDVARGDYLDYNDPIYQRMVDRLANETSADVNAAMGADGAYGSNVHVGALVDQVGGLRDRAAVAERQFELQRQQDALAAIEGTRQAGTQNRFSALAGQLGGAGTAYSMEQGGLDNVNEAAGMLPDIYGAAQLPASVYGSVGAAQDADAQAALTGQYDLFTRKNDAKADLLTRLAGLATSLGGAGGTKSTTEVPDTPWWQSVLSSIGQVA